MKRFIVFDGIDGAGKTLLAKMLAGYLRKKGEKVVLTHEPQTDTKLGKYLSAALREKNPPSTEELLKLFTADRKDHLRRVIIPAIRSGKIVICDRYYYSTLAYQLEKKDWDGYIKKSLKPAIAFICDLPAGMAMKRINLSIKKNERKSGKKAVYEKTSFLGKLRKKFLAMKSFEEVRIIDTKPSPSEIMPVIIKELGI